VQCRYNYQPVAWFQSRRWAQQRNDLRHSIIFL
jgi:hypothetical protein